MGQSPLTRVTPANIVSTATPEHAGVQKVPQRVAEHIDTVNHYRQRQARHDRHLADLEPDADPAPAYPLPDNRRGLNDAGQWIAVSNGFLLPSKAVMKKFRGKLLYTLHKALDQGKLKLPEGKSRSTGRISSPG